MDIRKYKDDNTIYRQKFDDYEVELPVDDWGTFSRKLAAAQPKRRRVALYYIAAAASVIGAMFLGFSFLSQQEQSEHELHFAKQETSRSNLQQNGQITAPAKTQNQHNYTLIAQVQSAPSKQAAGSSQKTEMSSDIAHLSSKLSNTKTAEEPTKNINETIKTIEVASNKPVTENFDTTGYITHPVTQYAELPALPTENSTQEEKNGNKKNSTGSSNLVKWLAGTFQGNLGLTSGVGGSLTNDGSIGSQLFNRVSQAASLSASSTPSLMSFSGKKTYYLPISFGISVGMPLSKRWELQSGLMYTRLTTTGELGAQYSGGSRSTGRIEQHYLGIPVSLAYSFIQKPSFAVYLIGGGRIEKGLSLVEKIYTYNAQNTPVEQEHYRYSINGVQLSLDAGIGASYRLYRFLHWYVETGGAWYVPCNQPESSRTEHPLNVSLKTGVKFSLSK